MLVQEIIEIVKEQIKTFDRPSVASSIEMVKIIEFQQKALQQIADLPGARQDEACCIALSCLDYELFGEK